VRCAISTGALARCVVTATAVVSGRPGPSATASPPGLTDDVQQVRVPTVLTELGVLAARPGGVRIASPPS